MQEQVAAVSVGSFTSKARVELVERLARAPPAPGVHRLQLYSGGAEAVESALRLAKSPHRQVRVRQLLGRLPRQDDGRAVADGLDVQGQARADGAGRAPWSRTPTATAVRSACQYPSCGIACAELARKHVKTAGAGSVAAVIVEPMQGTAGNVIPPKEFLPAVRSIADELGALLIADEMITGLGRTGKRWGVEHTGVRPDIVTIGKAFGGGFPLSGLLTTDEIAAAKPWGNPSGSSSSYGGNPLGAAAGAAALRIIDEEKLVENARVVGDDAARAAGVRRPLSVRRLRRRRWACCSAIELVADKKTKQPLPRRVTERIFTEA